MRGGGVDDDTRWVELLYHRGWEYQLRNSDEFKRHVNTSNPDTCGCVRGLKLNVKYGLIDHWDARFMRLVIKAGGLKGF